MDTPRLLREGTPCLANIMGGTELIIAIDFNHEPWRTLALVMLTEFNKNLEEAGFTFQNFDDLLDVIYQTKGDVQ